MKKTIAAAAALLLAAPSVTGCAIKGGKNSGPQPQQSWCFDRPCSDTAGAPTPTPQPSAFTVTPVPMTPPSLDARGAVPLGGLPRAYADAAPKPISPDMCASIAEPPDTGLYIDKATHEIVATVIASCYPPPPQIHITEISIWHLTQQGVTQVPGAYAQSFVVPPTPPQYRAYRLPIPCTAGIYGMSYLITWGTATNVPPTGTGSGGGSETAIVRPGDC